MSSTKSIRLRAAKDPSRLVTLEYADELIGLRQARVAGRRWLRPLIDLGDYSCRAVMDWVSITFEFARPTQFQYVQERLESVTGKSSYVVPSLPGPGGVATVFTVVFQEPNLTTIYVCHELLRDRFGEVSEPFVNELEVSVDFTPRPPSDDGRARMVAVLARHLYPGRNVFKRMATRPRFSWGPTKSQNSFTLGRSSSKLDDADLFLNPAGDVAPPIDATYYIGHRKVAALWRVMDKVIDRQNREARTWIELPEEEKRARVEVRLDRLELKALGVQNLSDLLQFNFAQLQGPYFKFMLPTFMAQAPDMSPTDRHWEQERVARFLNAGVVGLQALDEQRRSERAKHRPLLIDRLRAKGLKAPAVDRRGRGKAGTAVAYEVMNYRVSMALGKLVERERRMLE